MRKFIAGAFIASAFVASTALPAVAHNAELPCNIPVPETATVVSPGATDCIVQYDTLADAAAVVHAAMLDGRFVWPADDSGFIAQVGNGDTADYVVRVSDVNPSKPLEVVFSVAS